jgi:hypothetical protein
MVKKKDSGFGIRDSGVGENQRSTFSREAQPTVGSITVESVFTRHSAAPRG